MNEFKINNLKNIPLNIIEGTCINNPKAIIINIHGITSHFQELYYSEDCIRFKDSLFSSCNLKVYALEFHGHGKSGGLQCSIDNFDDLVDDLYCLVKHVNNIYPDKPIFFIAESMGGAVAIKYNIKYHFFYPIKGYILLSPMCGIDDRLKPNPIAINILMFLSNIIPTYKALDTNNKIDEYCHNQEFNEFKKKCKYNYNDKMRLNTARECYHTSLWIKDYGKLFNAPLFLLHGLNDRITNPQLSIDFYNKMPNKRKEIYLPNNTDHSLLVEINKDDGHPKIVLEKVKDWIIDLLNSN